ncbi:hypothetical protein [Micromonospora sp. NBC_00421]|uniref:hypothetical protein n=1 Tax=Micromonospora sp. NBC_00421 TaxID=2975976 RepID=UPI002E1DE0A5
MTIPMGYRKIAADLHARIQQGEYPPESRLACRREETEGGLMSDLHDWDDIRADLHDGDDGDDDALDVTPGSSSTTAATSVRLPDLGPSRRRWIALDRVGDLDGDHRQRRKPGLPAGGGPAGPSARGSRTVG